MVQRTMESFTLMTALLLCSRSWISEVSGSGSQIVEVQSGDEVTLTCSNISRSPAQTDWFRVINRTKPSCISSMFGSDGEASFCDGFQNGFEMSSNNSTVFLQIKRVDLSDSGLYFCGFYIDQHTIISSATYLIVQGNSDDGVDFQTEKTCDGTASLMSMILGSLIVVLAIVIVALTVKVRKLQTAVNEEPQPERNKDLGSAELNYAALNFQAKPKRSRRLERELEPHVTYAATR